LEPSSPDRETAQQLEQLRARVAAGNPQLYRHWALYLQVLREGLGQVVDQACFRLAVEVYPQRYRAMTVASRHDLHRRLAALVRRSCSLLTVEQLQALAAQIRRRQQRRIARQRRQWLSSLQQQGDGASTPEEPSGSVRLGMALPISLSPFGLGESKGPVADSDGQIGDDRDTEPSDGVLAAMAALMEDAEAHLQAEPAPTATPGHDGLMPVHPLALLAWVDDLDAALARRLRNLSHGINVELVRLGLGPSLVPLQLLEAAAAGQLEIQNAPTNLIKLTLPLPEELGTHGSETLAVWLRPTDIEVDQSRLRTCRSRLQQARQEVRRMAQTYHRLERRLQALEAEQLWLNDHSTAHRLPNRPTG
jgi:hypothetical protein